MYLTLNVLLSLRVFFQDPVVIWEDADPKKKAKDRHLFLFKDRILVTKMVRAESPGGTTPPQFNNKGVIQVGKNLQPSHAFRITERVLSL